MIFKTVLVLCACIATMTSAAFPPVPEGHSINAYVQEHGKNMLEQFARLRLQNVHPGGPDAVRDETVQTTAQSMFQRVVNMDNVEKHKYMTGVHARINKE